MTIPLNLLAEILHKTYILGNYVEIVLKPTLVLAKKPSSFKIKKEAAKFL